MLELTTAKEELPYRLVVLEGHMLYVDPDIVNWSDLNYFFTLTKEQCWERRKGTVSIQALLTGVMLLTSSEICFSHYDASTGNVASASFAS